MNSISILDQGGVAAFHCRRRKWKSWPHILTGAQLGRVGVAVGGQVFEGCYGDPDEKYVSWETNPKWWKIFVENIYTWYSSREKFLLPDFSGVIVESIWTTSLIVGRESGSNNKHSFAKYAIICISSVWNFPSSCGSGSSRITRLLSSNRGVACN